MVCKDIVVDRDVATSRVSAYKPEIVSALVVALCVRFLDGAPLNRKLGGLADINRFVIRPGQGQMIEYYAFSVG